MTTYMIYTRDDSGVLSRTGVKTVVKLDSGMRKHAEQLVGWPEKKVFWASDFGASSGLAIISAKTNRAAN